MSEAAPSLAPTPRRVPVLTHREVRELFVGIAKLDTKLDNVLGLGSEVDALRDEIEDLATRITKLEGFQGIILWVLNGGWAVVGVAAFILAKIGVL